MSALPDDEEPEMSAVEQAEMPIIPAGWKPTVREPVPVVRCTELTRAGTRCKRWSLRGTTQCIKHGGQLPNVQEHAAAVVEAAKLRLIGIADLAIDQIEDLMINASGEGIRLKAAQDVLDRASVKGAVEIDVTVRQEETSADRVAKRLAEMARRIEAKNTPVSSAADPDDEDIIDAVLEEGDESD
jgi:cytosine/adenosine deaminase-related metal-dependent hydrolase